MGRRKGLHLKKITLQGFKSFADRTTVDFSEGITAIVGPNGCGKSNISDAFRWVLGEQSAKSLRGGKMFDVIFAGTSSRKPLGLAEVTLTLAGNDGILPIEFDEVSVTRRLHRNGESEYLINNKPVRMKDIQSLFLDSGMGKNSFSIFEQGKMDMVIHQSPLERRHIFEEAAGILRFLQRKKEALRKLDQTEANMQRVQDIHGEVAKQIEILEQQAEEARQFKENKQRLVFLEKAVAVGKWEHHHKLMDQAELAEQELKESLSKVREEQVAGVQGLHQAKEGLEATEVQFRQRSEGVYQAKSQLEIKRKELQTGEDRLQEAQERESKLKQQLEELKEKRQVSRTVFEKNQVRQKEVEEQYVQATEALHQAKIAVEELNGQLTGLRMDQQKSQAARLELVQEESRLHTELEREQVRLETAKHQVAALEKELGELEHESEIILGELTVQEETVQNCSGQVDRLRGQVESLKEKAEETGGELKEEEEALEQSLQRFAETRARLKALERLQEEMEGLAKGPKKLLKAGKGKPLYSLLQPAQGQEQAFAAVMRPYLQTVVVETEKELQEVLSYAQQEGIRDFSILCLEGLPERPNTGSGWERLLSEAVESPIAQHFLGNIGTATSVSNGLSLVREHSAVEVVTQEGALVDQRGVVFFATQGEGNLFLREAEVKALRKQMKEFEKESLGREKQVNQLRGLKETIDGEIRDLDARLRKEEMRFVEVNFTLQQQRQSQEKNKQTIVVRKELLVEQSGAVQRHETTLKDLQVEHAKAKAATEASHVATSGLDTNLEQLEEELDARRVTRQEVETTYQRLHEEKQQLAHLLHLHEVKEQEAEEQEQRLLDELGVLQELQEQVKGSDTEIEGELADLTENLGQAEEAAQEAETRLKEWKEKIGAIEAQQQKILEQEKKINEAAHEKSVARAQSRSTLQAVEEDLYERHQLTIEGVKELGLTLDAPLDESEKEMRALRRKMDQAGDINLASIEEFEKHKVRYEFLHQQIDDLGGSRSELLEIITKLDEESRKLFEETFVQIRANFQRNFGVLFRGGEADLTFMESDDILDAGIEIVAKPPGKQMRSIQLLSGGEKCMTAMALLFAIFEVKSAPFCVLDEIDAPLDDANVGRFVDVVKQFIDRSQFIIITHNKRTMAIADRLFGVSMQEKGVSRILSMEFKHREEEEEQIEDVLVGTV